MKELNKVITMVMMGMVIFSMTSCNKEGVYNPKKKISKIYTQYEGQEKELRETWTWDKNKLVRIEYGGGYYIVFEYDKNRVSKIISDRDNYMEFVYNGSKLSKTNTYINKELHQSCIFEHDGKKISEMTMEQYNFDSKSKVAEASDKSFMAATLRFILPIQLSEAITLSTQKNRKADQEVDRFIFIFKWKGDNVEEMIVSTANPQEISTTSYTYDKKNNPYCDLFTVMDNSGLLLAFSKNNVLSERYSYRRNSDNNGSIASSGYTKDYSYTYDGNIPKERKMVQTDSYGPYSYTSVTYYEYK